MLLEGFYADAPHDVDKPLDFAVAAREVQVDQLFYHVGHFGLRHRRAQHFAQRRMIAL